MSVITGGWFEPFFSIAGVGLRLISVGLGALAVHINHHGTLLTCRYSMSGIACTGIRSTRRVATAVEEDLLKGYMKAV